MNPAMLTRVWTRHRHMKDRPAYRGFLEAIAGDGDVWKVPQRDVAEWWELRQRSGIEVSNDQGSATVQCNLKGAVIEVDGSDLRVPPFALATAPPTGARPRVPAALESEFLREVLGHLGFDHVRASGDTDGPGLLPAAVLEPLMQRLRSSAISHRRYEEEDLAQLTAIIADAHHACGLPSLRLWPLPHSGGRPWRVAVSTRYDVDKAIVNLPDIHALEAEFGLRSTVYLRPFGMFYGSRQIRAYLEHAGGSELALHGEFISTADSHSLNEAAAARLEKEDLARTCGSEIVGVCMHGGELRTNTSPRTRDAIESAGFRYETMYRNRYYLPLHLPTVDGVRETLSIGQHFADITVPGTATYSDELQAAFIEQYAAARAVGGVFVPVMHPLYFDIGNYLSHPINLARIAAFMPVFAMRVVRMKQGQPYSNLVE